MFCPGCGFQANDDLKFCRQCGANLRGVRDAMTLQSTGKIDWNKTWWAEILYPKEELERLRGVTPEEKLLNEEKNRLNEIKGGVITSLVGVGVMISFYFFFGVVAQQESGGDAEIIRNLWLLGIVPTLVGIGLLINGFFVSHRLVKLKEQLLQTTMSQPQTPTALPAKTTDQLVVDAALSSRASVTEDSTAHLPEPALAPLRREAD